MRTATFLVSASKGLEVHTIGFISAQVVQDLRTVHRGVDAVSLATEQPISLSDERKSWTLGPCSESLQKVRTSQRNNALTLQSPYPRFNAYYVGSEALDPRICLPQQSPGAKLKIFPHA